jgi:LacI family transcriptional regulator
MQAAGELGYELKRYRRRRSSAQNVIGVIITEHNDFFSSAVNAIERIAHENNFGVVICNSFEDNAREMQCLNVLCGEVDGLIVVPSSQTAQYNAKFIKEIDSEMIPVVLLDRDLSNEQLDGAFVDGFRGAYNAVRTLISNGHSNIAIMSGPTTNKPGLDRLNGYLAALRDNHIPIREEYILYGEFKKELAYSLTGKLLKKHPEVTAIFSANLIMSFGCLEAIDKANVKIPEQLAFITFDDFFIFETNKISVVNNPGCKLGEEAMKSLISRIRSDKRSKYEPSRRIILMPHLILRGSERYPFRKNY